LLLHDCLKLTGLGNRNDSSPGARDEPPPLKPARRLDYDWSST
jgi:hypothetical protein